MSVTTLQKPGAPVSSWTTPRLLRTLRSGTVALQLALLVVTLYATQKEQQALDRLGQQAIPGIVSVAEMRTALAKMDLAAAEELGQGGLRESTGVSAYENRHSETLRHLLDAASDPLQSMQERESLQALEEGLNRYDVAVARGRDLSRNRAVTSAAEASILNQDLLPAADRIRGERESRAAAVFAGERTQSNEDRFLLACVGTALLLILLISQSTLSQRTRRTLNIALLLTTFLTVAEAAHAWVVVTRLHGQFQGELRHELSAEEAGENAAAAAAVFQGRIARSGRDENTAQDRALSLVTQAESVAGIPQGLSLDQTIAALREGRVLEGFHGYLADAWAAATSRPQRDSLLRALAVWQPAARPDHAARAGDPPPMRAQGGAEDEAARKTYRSREVTFDEAVKQAGTLALQQSEETARQAGSEISHLEVTSALVAVVCLALVLLGFAPRLREYD